MTRRSRHASRLGLLLCALAGSGFTVVRDPSLAEAIRWTTLPVAVVLQQDGVDDVTDGSDLAGVRAALAAWDAPSCASFAFVESAVQASRVVADDGVNRITFIESGWSAGASGALALTDRYRDTGTSPQRWNEFDIRINGQDFLWATNGDVHRRDVQAVVTHELGHALGLQHSALPDATMYFASPTGAVFGRTLHADDVRGLCWLYSAAPFTCSSDAECPLLDGGLYAGGTDTRLRCNGVSCVAGAAGFASDCLGSGDCSSSACVRLDSAPGSDPGYCAQACGGGCPPDTYCSSGATGSPLCVVGTADCRSDAECGTLANVVCSVDLDGRSRCERLCLSNANCPTAGTVCHGGTGANPPGFCRAPGVAAAGAACSSSYDCASLLCSVRSDGTAACAGSPVTGNEPTPLPDGGTDPDGGDGEPDGGASDGAGDATTGTDPGAEPGADPTDASGGDSTTGADGLFDGDADGEGLTGDDLAGGDVEGGCAARHPDAVALTVAALLLGLWGRRRR